MTSSRLRERLARLGPIRDIDRVTGSPAVAHLSCDDRAAVKAVSATRELARRGLSLLRAKRTVEAVLELGFTAIRLPAVEDRETLAKSLRNAGISVGFVVDDLVDVRGLRERLDLTREQFAWRFNLSIDTVEKWESGEREPDRAANNYLRVIAADPELAIKALAGVE